MVSSTFVNIWIPLSLAIFIPFLIFFVFYKKSNSFYFIKDTGDFYGSKVGKDKKIHVFLRKITLKKWRVLVQTYIKEFFRNDEYIIKFFFTIVLNIILGIVLAISLSEFERDLISVFQIYKLLEIFIVSWIGSILLGSLSGLYIFIESKSLLYAYKKSIRGIKSLIYSFLYFLIYLIIFIDLVSVGLFTIIFQLDLLTVLIFIVTYFILNLNIAFEMIGIQCLKPVFKNRKSMVMINIYILMILQIFSLFLAFSIFVPFISDDIEPTLALLDILMIHFGLNSGIGIVLFFLGLKKINKFE
jgi:hypothetical protein